jgi:hypothetical protein
VGAGLRKLHFDLDSMAFFLQFGGVNEPSIIQGRLIGAAELEQIRHLMALHPEWSRRRLSEQLATLWDWRNGVGQLKDMAARTLMLKLERRGWIELPPRRRVTFSRMRHQQMPLLEAPIAQLPVVGELKDLLPLELAEVSQKSDSRALFENLLHHHHYLSYRSTVGENIRYLARDRQGRPLACLLFGAAAWKCADRDNHIGWDAARRAGGVQLIANNTRFLIPNWVQVPNLASYLLSRVARELSQDWNRKYGHPIYLMETFVECDRFAGTCYRAANWLYVGQTVGRSRQSLPNGKNNSVPIKHVYLYPLHRHYRQKLQGNALSPPVPLTPTPASHL